jgi:hypothetical protein
MTDFDEADIRALRQRGGLRAFLREQQAEGKARHDKEPAPSIPGHQPGVWPTGASPPGQPPHPEHAIACPHCGAPPGTRCTSRARSRPLAIPSHDARLTAWTAQTTAEEDQPR